MKNYKHDNNLKISDILKEQLRSEKDIMRKNKINLIIKEDLEKFIIFYKKENNKNGNLIQQIIYNQDITELLKSNQNQKMINFIVIHLNLEMMNK